MTDIIIAIILGIVEGLTEFLPVSSTGHLVLVSEFTQKATFADKAFRDFFNIFIQFGAILAVIVYFWDRLYPFNKQKTPQENQQIWATWQKAIIGFLPAAVLGFLFDDIIEGYLMNPFTIAIALIFWGLVMIWLESQDKESRMNSVAEMSIQLVLLVGLIQCLAMVPGTSRSAATIIGAMMLGCSRIAAAEFSFFLAIPTIGAASMYSLLKALKSGMDVGEHALTLAIGFVTAFAVAWLVIAAFMRFITTNNFKPFGYYRIALGILVLWYFMR
jgi:undecaprenyl-diphosphatase